MVAGVVSYMLGVVFNAGLVSLTSSYPSPCSPYSSELIVLGVGVWFAFRVLQCVRVRRHGAFVFCGRENRSVKFGQPLWCVTLFLFI